MAVTVNETKNKCREGKVTLGAGVRMARTVEVGLAMKACGLSLYRLDINFRESAVVGVVGAGGIGATLNTAFDRYEFDVAAAILLLIIGIVLCGEVTSGRFRKGMV